MSYTSYTIERVIKIIDLPDLTMWESKLKDNRYFVVRYKMGRITIYIPPHKNVDPINIKYKAADLSVYDKNSPNYFKINWEDTYLQNLIKAFHFKM